MGKRRQFTDEFEQEAVRLLETRDDRSPVSVAEGLGGSQAQLYDWRRKYADVARSVRVERGETPEEELKRLRRENHQLRRDKEILKKASAFFAKESL